MSPRHFDLICFDWDGTLFDSTAVITRCIQQAVVDVGGQRPSDQAAAYVIGLGLEPALAHVAPNVPRTQYAALGLRFRHHYLQHQNDMSLFAGVVPLLQVLRARGFQLAVATGKSRSGLDAALATAHLGVLFDATRTADETAGKPDPRMLLELMAELECSPRRTLMVGDTSHDLRMARNAGCAGVGVAYGAHPGADLGAYSARFVAATVAELAAWLETHG